MMIVRWIAMEPRKSQKEGYYCYYYYYYCYYYYYYYYYLLLLLLRQEEQGTLKQLGGVPLSSFNPYLSLLPLAFLLGCCRCWRQWCECQTGGVGGGAEPPPSL